jgi:SAM-dependent methyltransferase
LSSEPSLGELYDWEQAQVIERSEQDLPFYARLIASPDRRALELACGTGRLLSPLAKAGVDIVGLDIDPAMLAVARRRNRGLRLVRGDMRHFAFAQPFDVVILAYNGLQLLLTEDDRRACMTAIAAHLAPDGVVAFEVHDFLVGVESTTVAPERLRRGPLGRLTVTLHGGLHHDLDTRVTTYTRHFELKRWGRAPRIVDDDVALYSFAPGELEGLLADAGLHGRVEHLGNAVERWVAGRIGHPLGPVGDG